MTTQSERAALLAEQIREAVAQAAPPAPAAVRPPSSGPEDGARSALERAGAHVTPTIPEGAPLSALKRFALRVLRFAWRDEAAFHALSLEASRTLVDCVAGQRVEIDRLRQTLAAAEQGQEASRAELARWLQEAERSLAAWRRHVAIEEARLAQLEAASSGSARVVSGPPGPEIPPGVYSLFEERFRGSPQEIEAKQREYVAVVRDAPGPVLDVGCGRGEFLRLLRQEGLAATGVEINPIAVQECRDAGLTVEQEDAVAALARRPAASLGAVVAFQVVEHWKPETIFLFLREAARALAPGGMLIAETINVDSLSAWRTFFLDPSHVRPVPPEELRFLAEAAGFSETRIEYRAALAPEERLVETTDNDAKLNRLLFGPQDYALIARVPSAGREA